MGRLADAVEATWAGEGSAAARAMLRALSVPYAAVVGARNMAFDRGLLTMERVPARVVSVGNLVVGGSGKTPFALWLASRLQAAGRRPAIVARGYGKRGRGVVVVGAAGRALVGPGEGGDEAVLLARRFAGPVVTGAARVVAARLAIERFGVDTIVLDDGFQHRRLARNVDVVLAGALPAAVRLLPAGPYREPLGSLGRASAVVVVDDTPAPAVACPVFRARVVPEAVVRADGDVWRTEPLDVLADRPVVAASGIARPERFVGTLRALGARVVRQVVRPDHHPWSASEVADLVATAGGALVVTTEKDLVKWAPAADADVAAVRVGMQVDDGGALVRLAGGLGVVCE